jgi:hypothetical protein
MFLSTEGSDIILTSISLPHARLNAAATFMFIGNFRTASPAFPSYSMVSSSAETPRDLGGLRVTSVALSILPIEAALMPSIPTMAPDGAYIFALL